MGFDIREASIKENTKFNWKDSNIMDSELR
jgi:hypothetical protein